VARWACPDAPATEHFAFEVRKVCHKLGAGAYIRLKLIKAVLGSAVLANLERISPLAICTFRWNALDRCVRLGARSVNIRSTAVNMPGVREPVEDRPSSRAVLVSQIDHSRRHCCCATSQIIPEALNLWLVVFSLESS
jgi:hypothetical protein